MSVADIVKELEGGREMTLQRKIRLGHSEEEERTCQAEKEQNLFKTCLFSLTPKHNADTSPWRPHRHDAWSKNVLTHGGDLPCF